MKKEDFEQGVSYETALQHSYSMVLGKAGFAAASILLLLETGITSEALRVALISFCICLPLSLLIAFIDSILFFRFPMSVGYLDYIVDSKLRCTLIKSLSPLSSIAILVGTHALVWHLDTMAFWIFLATTLTVGGIFSWLYNDKKRYLKDEEDILIEERDKEWERIHEALDRVDEE